MTIGYIGAVGISLVAQMLSTPVSWYTSILLLAILGVVGTLVMALVRETGEAAKKRK
jgi:multisubunit Na+/H+ antiporter MnhF subunit